MSPQSPDEQEAWDSNVIELETVDGRREFIRLSAPVNHGPERDGYAIYIDVTAQRQRRERLRVLSRMLRHNIRNKLNVIQSINTISDELNETHRKHIELASKAADDLLETAFAERADELGDYPAEAFLYGQHCWLHTTVSTTRALSAHGIW